MEVKQIQPHQERFPIALHNVHSDIRPLARSASALDKGTACADHAS